MRLNNLILEQYRNYSQFAVDFNASEPITVFIGPNGKGKTNILEAIYTLSLTKSFRTPRQPDVIQWDQEYARIKGTFSFEDEVSENQNPLHGVSNDYDEASRTEAIEREVFIGLPPHPTKRLKINGVQKSAVDFIGNCPMVFFHPEDLNMLYLGPELRRRFMDILGLQVNAVYYRTLKAYQRILNQRNALLKKIQQNESSITDLDVWDEQIIEQASYLIKERLQLLEFLEERLSELYSHISGNNDQITITYKNSLILEQQSIEADVASIKTAYSIHFQQYRQKDIYAGFTTAGPHRDDILFELNRRPLLSHASRGEYRSLFLALKQAELLWYEQQTQHTPLLLLDDVFSELDPFRQQHLLESMRGYQCFITTTHLPELLKDIDSLRIIPL